MSRTGILTLLIAATVATASCTRVQDVLGGLFPDPAARLAREVTIQRDEWGVPHIHGATDAAAVFGLAYAQAEDDFRQLEDDLVRALGRSAELYGEEALAADLSSAAFEVERLSREEYEREPPERRRLWDAYAHGINHYLRTHPDVRPRLLTRFEPWFVFALPRTVPAGTIVDGIRLGVVDAMVIEDGSAGSGYQLVGRFDPAHADPGAGGEGAGLSNSWTVAPSRSASGRALLFHNPHVGFFGPGQRYEVHVRSDEGWHFSGFAQLAAPVPRSGHNEQLGWSHTDAAADVADAWFATFDHPTDPLAYRHGDGWRQATEWEDTIRVRVDTTIVVRRYRFRKTHHGPVVATDGDRGYAVRIARLEDGGSLQQWYAMTRATSLAEFLAALAATALPTSSTMYADRDGNILYVHGNAVPRRDVRLDWTRPVDGSDPMTEWQGYHPLADLPQLLNPPSGWLQNASSTPFLATADGHNLDPNDYPAYMSREADNARARVSREILAADSEWTFDEWERAAFDTRVIGVDDHVGLLVDEWERLGAADPDRALRLESVVDSLRRWNGTASVNSVPTTHFVLWLERLRAPGAADGEWPRVRALETVVAELEEDWGTTTVPWGEVNRHQRIAATSDARFDPAAPSLPIAGAPGWTGIVFSFHAAPGPEGKLRFGRSGHSWLGITEFGPQPRARTVVPFGQSADPASPHFFDQAPLYGRGELKEAWFQQEQVEAAARHSYTPGVEMR